MLHSAQQQYRRVIYFPKQLQKNKRMKIDGSLRTRKLDISPTSSVYCLGVGIIRDRRFQQYLLLLTPEINHHSSGITLQ